MKDSTIGQYVSRFRSTSGVTLCCLGMFLYAISGQPKPAVAMPMPVAVFEPPAAPTETMTHAPDARWAAAASRLEQADRESAKAMDTRLAEFAGFLVERKKGVIAFAMDMTSTEAKLNVAMASGLGILDVFGKIRGGNSNSGLEHIQRYARARFARHMLTPEQLKQAAERVAANYGKDINEIEGRLMADLQISMPNIRPNSQAVYCATTFDTASPGYAALIQKAINAVEAALAKAGFNPKSKLITLLIPVLEKLHSDGLAKGMLMQALQEMHGQRSELRREHVRRDIYRTDAQP